MDKEVSGPWSVRIRVGCSKDKNRLGGKKVKKKGRKKTKWVRKTSWRKKGKVDK